MHALSGVVAQEGGDGAIAHPIFLAVGNPLSSKNTKYVAENPPRVSDEGESFDGLMYH